jgi:hypothetical protein
MGENTMTEVGDGNALFLLINKDAFTIDNFLELSYEKQKRILESAKTFGQLLEQGQSWKVLLNSVDETWPKQ